MRIIEPPVATGVGNNIQAIFDPLPAPTPIATYAGTGTTLVAGTTGTALVDGGRVYNAGRTTGSVVALTWQNDFTVPVLHLSAGLKLRFAVPTSKTGTIEVQLDSAAPLTASGNGTVWTSSTITVRTDVTWSWFEVTLPARSDAGTNIRVNLPPGQIQVPCTYAVNALVNLIPTTPTGLRLKDTALSQEMVFRPAELAKKTELPDLATYAKKTDPILTPDLRWIATSDDVNAAYVRNFTGALASIEFDYAHATGSAFATFSLTDFVTGFNSSSYWWNAPTKFTNVTLNGMATVVVVSLKTSTSIGICIIRTSGNVKGRIRKVKINGQAADLIPIETQLSATQGDISGLNIDAYARLTDIPVVPSLAPVTDRVTAIENSLKPAPAPTLLATTTNTPGRVMTVAELTPVTAPTTSPVSTDPTLAQDWVVTPLVDGEEWRNTAKTGLFFRVVFTATGFDFTYGGITGSPWSITDGTSRSFTGTLAAQTKSYVSSANSVTVTIPGNAKTFTILKPATDGTIGWVLVGQDTRIGYFSGVYQANSSKGYAKILWGKNTAVVQVWGQIGNWLVDQRTTTQQPQQTIAIAGTETQYLTLDNSTQIKITTPSNEALTLNRPRLVTTWDGAIERPSPYQSTVWEPPDIGYTDATQYYQWRNKADVGEYLRVTFGATNTTIERVKAAAQRDDWYRLTRADGSVVTGKAGGTIITGRFVLFEVWYASGLNASVPTTPADFYLPLPINLGDKTVEPQLWTDFIDAKNFALTPAGKAIAALKASFVTQTLMVAISSGVRDLLLTSTAQSYDLGATLQEGDLVTLHGDYANDAALQGQNMVYRVRRGAGVRVNAWPATDHNVTVNFPNSLTSAVTIAHGTGNTTFRVRGWLLERPVSFKVLP